MMYHIDLRLQVMIEQLLGQNQIFCGNSIYVCNYMAFKWGNYININNIIYNCSDTLIPYGLSSYIWNLNGNLLQVEAYHR